jgi:hypothetical protein
MGNTSSDVNDSLKAQADGSIEVYKLVNLGGGGQLAELMIAALTKKDYTEVDNFIKNEVVKFLYNEGNGAQVRIFIKNFYLNFSYLILLFSQRSQ